MNKQTIIDSFRGDLRASVRMRGLCGSFPEFFTEMRFEPAAFAGLEDEVEKSVASTSDSVMSIVSFATNMSRVDMEKVILREVLRNRSELRLFSDLDKLSEDASSSWYMIEKESELIRGPLSSEKMDQKLASSQIDETTRVKRKCEEDYYPLSVLLRRYYKNFLEEKLQLGREKDRLPRKVATFNRGMCLGKRSSEPEELKVRGRNSRVASDLPRPQNLDFLRTEFDRLEQTNHFNGRSRAKTIVM